MTYQNNTLIVCPTAVKMRILNSLSEKKDLYNLKFMTKEEFKNNYYFSYDEKALFYLMHKYNLNLDVAKVYVNNLYAIDTKKNYQNQKLKFLKELKIELQQEGLLKTNPTFKKYLSAKNIMTLNYYDLDKYEEEILNHKVEIPTATISTKVVEAKTIEEEVNYVSLEILKLLNKGVDINKIFLANVTSDYYYIISRLFKYYHIPINLDTQESIYSTEVVSTYLKTGNLDLEDKNKSPINRKLISVLSSLLDLDSQTPEYRQILLDKLKHTYLPTKKKTSAVNIKNLYQDTFKEDEYIFVLGFNQDVLPKMEKDIAYINDSLKYEVPLYTTAYINKRNKQSLIYILSTIKNLYLSYKLSTPFAHFYPSSIISDLNLEVINPPKDEFDKSNIYNRIRLAEKLDLYYLYGEKGVELDCLNATYQIPYNTYSNQFTGINNDIYLTNLAYPLKLSYTSLNTYNECAFKYYIKYVLKLDKYEDNFSAFIGSLYHNILSLYQKSKFSLEEEYQKYLKKRDLSLKERLLLIRIKKDLINLIDTLKQQQLLTGYDNALYEKKVEVPLDKKVSVIFTGTIDKIMYYQKVEDTYFSIIDYKTGSIDVNIEPMKYGLHMQLPVYLYLIHYSKIFSNPIFTGIYYQNIMFPYPTWTSKKDKEEIYKDNLKLQGYSTEDTTVLARFDSTYEKSDYIKSMAYTEEKGFSTYAKVINDNTLYNLVKYTKKHISTQTDSIIASNFIINPKVYAGKNIACGFCNYKDLCYMKDSNQIYLDKVNDLSFLGDDV